MHLTDAEIALIRGSYDHLKSDAERLSALFYDNLFTRAPDIRALFGDDLEAQGMRFMSAIWFIVENMDNEADLNAKLDLLAGGHAAYGLKPAVYREMEEALIDTFKHAFKAKWTDALELAWRSAFHQICDTMIDKTEAIRWPDSKKAS